MKSNYILAAVVAPFSVLAQKGNPVPFGPAPQGCNKYEVIIGRGTGEGGKFGVIVGDPLLRAILAKLPEARGYAVQYPASSASNSYQIGADDILKRLTTQIEKCPDQKFALVGYSQGARIAHIASRKFTDAIISKIVATAMYGDPAELGPGTDSRPSPAFPPSLNTKTRFNCAPKDPACDKSAWPKLPDGKIDSKGSPSFTPHLTYNSGNYHSLSAAFIVAGFQGNPLPKSNGK